MESTMFGRMRQAALERLQGRDPETIAQNSGVEYDSETRLFRCFSLGKEINISYPFYNIIPELPGWHSLVILHYLDMANGTPVQNTAIPFSAMLSGMVRGEGVDRKCEEFFSGCTLEQVKNFCLSVGAVQKQDNADYSAMLPFLPRFPVILKYWKADEDFSASGRLFVDGSADGYLTIEDAVTVAEVILEFFSASIAETPHECGR